MIKQVDFTPFYIREAFLSLAIKAAMAGASKCFLVLFLFLVFAEASLSNGIGIPDRKSDVSTIVGIHLAPRINCDYSCARRCSKASRTKVCMRACGSCCATCQCVPAGTYGNTKSCPCYANLKTHGKQPKCP